MKTRMADGRLAAALLSAWLVVSGAAGAAEIRVGTIEILTADDFEAGRSERIVTLVTARGERTALSLPAGSPEPADGARVAVTGEPRAGAFEAARIEVLFAAPAEAPRISGNSTVIAINIKFLDTETEPYTVTQVQNTVLGASSSAAAYYAEASFGSHTLSGFVTPWLTARIDTPTTCDPYSVSAEADYAATQAGYNPYSYQKRVYVFPHIPCGWAGLGGGSSAWINQALNVLVVGHELGHCFGLGHASSLDCGEAVLGGTCSKSEYGDRFEIMGNSHSRHFNALHKNQLGYLPAGSVAVHSSGSGVYTLSPIESPGGATYAVQIPLAGSNRTYWLEYRQPIGFDGSIGANPANGAIAHLAWPNDYSCFSCLLDMTPTNGGFDNAALEVGESYFDSTAGLRIAPLSRDAQSLTVQVELGPSPPFGVDRHAVGSPTNLNAVLEPGETASVEPSFANAGGGDLAVTGTATSLTGPGGGSASYQIVDAAADYGLVAAGGNAPCFDATQDCYAVSISASPRPAPHWDATFGETLSTTEARSWTLHVGSSFSDAPTSRGDYAAIETVFHHGITSGCGGAKFCPDTSLTRAQMAVFLLKASHGAGYTPPPATGTVFGDVPAGSFAAAWIEQLAEEGVTAGCGSGANFCPGAPVTRAQMAVFLLKAREGSGYAPPPASGVFTDVPAANPFAPWIEQIADEGVTAGCAANLYCPSAATRRGQLAVFLTKGFGLVLYGP